MSELVKTSLDKLGKQREPRKPLPPQTPASSIGAATGHAKPQSPTPKGTGAGGIASPLTEADYTARSYYASEILTSTDGLFSFLVRRVESITMTDANGDAVMLNFANKPEPEA